MEIKVRQRLVGGVVLAALAVIFIPMFLHGSKPEPRQITLTADLPPAPPKPLLQPELAQQQLTQPTAQTILTQQSNVLAPPAPTPHAAIQPQAQPQPQPQSQVAAAKAANVADNQVIVIGNNSQPVAVLPASQPVPHVALTTEPIAPTPKAKAKPKLLAATKPAVHRAQARPVSMAKLVDIDDQVKAEQVSKNAKAIKTAPIKTKTSPAVGSAWIVQLGSFSTSTNAKKLAADLRAKGFAANTEEYKTSKGKRLTRVYIGPELHHEWAQTVQSKLNTEMHLKGVVVAYEPA